MGVETLTITGAEVVGVEVVKEGSFVTVRQYLAGNHEHLGCLHNGWSGVETIRERTFVTPIETFMVIDRPGSKEESAGI